MESYDLRKLGENADINIVAEYLGMKTYKKGSNIFVHCPNPEHNDVHPTNCFFKPRDTRMYCAVCQKSFGAIDLVMLKTGKGIIDAAKEVWEIEGCPSWGKTVYETSDKKKSKEFFLTTEELRVLQIKLPYEAQLTWRDFVDQSELKKIVRIASKKAIEQFNRTDEMFKRKIDFEGTLFEEERKIINGVLKRMK